VSLPARRLEQRLHAPRTHAQNTRARSDCTPLLFMWWPCKIRQSWASGCQQLAEALQHAVVHSGSCSSWMTHTPTTTQTTNIAELPSTLFWPSRPSLTTTFSPPNATPTSAADMSPSTYPSTHAHAHDDVIVLALTTCCQLLSPAWGRQSCDRPPQTQHMCRITHGRTSIRIDAVATESSNSDITRQQPSENQPANPAAPGQ
jgi:hypothetical protein